VNAIAAPVSCHGSIAAPICALSAPPLTIRSGRASMQPVSSRRNLAAPRPSHKPRLGRAGVSARVLGEYGVGGVGIARCDWIRRAAGAMESTVRLATAAAKQIASIGGRSYT
jgi:hypothetical protein